MSYTQVKPVTWRVHRLLCECGGEFEHKFNVNYAENNDADQQQGA